MKRVIKFIGWWAIFSILLVTALQAKTLRSLGPQLPSDLEIPSAAITGTFAQMKAQSTVGLQIGDEWDTSDTNAIYKWNGSVWRQIAMRGTDTPTWTVTPTFTPTNTLTFTPTFTSTPTFTPTNTFTNTTIYTNTFTPTPTNTTAFTNTPTNTNTLPAGTNTFTPVNTNTFTNTRTPTFTNTPTYTNTPTFTWTSSPTNTLTFTSTNTNTPTITPTPTMTNTPANYIFSQSATAVPTQTNSFVQMSGNSITLSPGNWTVGGMVAAGNDVASITVLGLSYAWASTNGDNTSSVPATLVTGGNISVNGGIVYPLYGGVARSMINVPAGPSGFQVVVPEINVTVTSNYVIYLDTYVNYTGTRTNCILRSSIWATRLTY